MNIIKRRAASLAVVVLTSAFALAACGGSEETTPPASTAPVSTTAAEPSEEPTAADPGYPTEDTTSDIEVDEALAAAVPADISADGKLYVGATETPGTAFLPQGGTAEDGTRIGLQADLLTAIGKVLGLEVEYESAEFAAIIPGVGTKFELGQGNFALTGARLETVDQVPYLIDGQAVVARADLDLDKITSITDLCGYKLIAGAGSLQAAVLGNIDLATGKPKATTACADAGKDEWEAQILPDTTTAPLALTSGKADAFFIVTTYADYVTQKVQGLKNLGEISWTNVGYAIPKGSAFGPVLADAINHLIETGEYQAIFEKWGVPDAAQKESRVVTAADASDTSLVGTQTGPRP